MADHEPCRTCIQCGWEAMATAQGVYRGRHKIVRGLCGLCYGRAYRAGRVEKDGAETRNPKSPRKGPPGASARTVT